MEEVSIDCPWHLGVEDEDHVGSLGGEDRPSSGLCTSAGTERRPGGVGTRCWGGGVEVESRVDPTGYTLSIGRGATSLKGLGTR